MEQKKDNSILIRLTDEEVKKLNDGWFKAVAIAGSPITKSEYMRKCIDITYNYLKDLEVAENGGYKIYGYFRPGL